MMINEQKCIELKDKRGLYAERQQEQASNPQNSVWVEASAGTGKTKVLSDRVLRLFLDGVNPAQILCLTYTKAAAVEMNDRISGKLADWAVMPENELYKELNKLLKNQCSETILNRARTLFALVLEIPGGIKIQTLHSFCQEILKRFPLEAGIPPYFTVMEDRMAREILDNVSRELILKIEREPDTDVARATAYLTTHVSEFKFSDLMNMLAQNRAKISDILSAYPNFAAFLTALQARLDLPEILSREQAIKNFGESRDWNMLRKVSAALAQSKPTDKKNAELLTVLEKNFRYKTYKSIFLTQENTIKARLACQNAEKALPEILTLMGNEGQEILKLEDKLKRLQLYESTRAIMAVAHDLSEGYTEYKRQNARLDYEDLIVLTHNLLENKSVADWILYKLDAAVSHILIDEAQDTSPRQWAIIRALSSDFFAGMGQNTQNRTIFAVGDRKQSIYSFQGADPKEFDTMRQYFAKQADNFKKVRLDVSFRSTAAVLETVNELFAMEEARSGVVIDDEKVDHLPFRVGHGGKVQIWPLVEIPEDNGDDVWYPPIERKVKKTACSLLAAQVAQNIKNMVTGKEILVSQNRPIQYGDIMVLVQRRKAFVEDFVRECKNIGVQITGVDKLKLLDQIAVEDLLSLGNFLLLPEDDLSLAEVLKSPLFGLDDDDLFDLCYNRDSSLWNSLRKNPKYMAVTEVLTDLLSKVDYIRPFELFNYVLTTLKGRQKFAERLGAEAEDALNEFINLTLSFEQEHIPDLQSFMAWVAADKVEIKRELEQSDVNAVRLMTVHGSKGLQAPIVILPDTTRIVNMKHDSKILWDDGKMAYFPLNSESYDKNCNRIYERDYKNAFDEYRRLLYVALTRAEDRLYICGYKSQTNISEKSWYYLCQKTLEKIGISEENDNLTFSVPQQIQTTKDKSDETVPPIISQPDWLTMSVQTEGPLSKPYMPSHIEEDNEISADSPLTENGNGYRRGLLIHHILQSLPAQADKALIKDFIHTYLQRNAVGLPDSFYNQIEHEIMNLYENPEFAFIFGPDSYAEVPVAGEVDGRLFSAQIDRLYVGSDKVVIVDFKTNRSVATNKKEVPLSYLKQLRIYKLLIEKIYPQLPVETYLLWTNNANLMKID